MKQRPIPQDITGYKFHLIGSMTLKQFAELAAGAIIAFIVYKSNLIGVVKWPLFVFIVILAIMIAFVPIEERPLDFWIITYLKNLWKPTKFFWKRTPKIPDFFNYKPGQNQHLDINPEVNFSPARKQRIQEYLKSIPESDEELDEWDIHYNQRAQNLLASFDQVKVKSENISVQRETETDKPQLKTRIRKLKSLEQIQEQQARSLEQEVQDLELPNNAKASDDPSKIQATQNENKNYIKQKKLSDLDSDRTNNAGLEVGQANQLIGIVSDSSGKAVSNALIEVFANDQDQALRISKSNSQGEFYIKTALPDGEYLIKTEAENLEFAPLSIRLTGRIVPPINIEAE